MSEETTKISHQVVDEAEDLLRAIVRFPLVVIGTVLAIARVILTDSIALTLTAGFVALGFAIGLWPALAAGLVTHALILITRDYVNSLGESMRFTGSVIRDNLWNSKNEIPLKVVQVPEVITRAAKDFDPRYDSVPELSEDIFTQPHEPTDRSESPS